MSFKKTIWFPTTNESPFGPVTHPFHLFSPMTCARLEHIAQERIEQVFHTNEISVFSYTENKQQVLPLLNIGPAWSVELEIKNGIELKSCQICLVQVFFFTDSAEKQGTKCYWNKHRLGTTSWADSAILSPPLICLKTKHSTFRELRRSQAHCTAVIFVPFHLRSKLNYSLPPRKRRRKQTHTHTHTSKQLAWHLNQKSFVKF